MSAKIGQLIEVIEEVRGKYQGVVQRDSITQVRIDAGKAVAARRGITSNSVSDKFIYGLVPDVVSTPQFDLLLKEWLIDGSTTLKDILLKHALDAKDRLLITNFFHRAPPQDILLAEEFGFNAADEAFLEGREKLRIHLSKERNRDLIKLAKELWLSHGELCCSICSFSFASTYGMVGEGFIEAHHNTPVSQLSEDTIVRPADLSPVCSNCHGIIHRHRPWLTIEQMRAIVVKAR